MTKASKWWQFTKERFEPVSHLLMIAMFVLTHVLITKRTFNAIFPLEVGIVLFIAVVAFYFKLRLYDEIKDYELDCEINPHRPLPRGLLTRRDMYNGMGLCIMVEAFLFASKGLNPFVSMTIAIFYSLIMYKEFFIREKIRPHLTTYALVHTVVTILLSLAIFSFITNLSFSTVLKDKTMQSFALCNWFLFNLFEFGRKSFAPEEERSGVDTYSSLFGKSGAVALSTFQTVAAHYFAFRMNGYNEKLLAFSQGTIFVFFIVIALNYLLNSRVYAAKLFRKISSVYIILFYLTLIASFTF